MRFILALLGLLLAPQAHAQTSVGLYCYQGPTNPQWAPCNAGAFIPNGNYASITAAGSSNSVALPAGTTVGFQNTGTTAVSCTLGVGAATATASNIIIQPGSTKFFVVGTNTFGACIDQTGTVTNVVVLYGGSGLGIDSGGGGGGGLTGSLGNNADNVAPVTTGNIGANAYSYVFDGTNWQRAQPVNAGTAGVAGTDVLSVQGIASMTPVQVATSDPCTSLAKSSVPINITSATTTSLVATSGTATVYGCGLIMTIAPSATSADTALVERGTGAACVTTQAALTGTFGSGDLTTAAPPTVVSYGSGGSTIFKSAGSDAICLVTAGTTVNVQGVFTYVQQ